MQQPPPPIMRDSDYRRLESAAPSDYIPSSPRSMTTPTSQAAVSPTARLKAAAVPSVLAVHVHVQRTRLLVGAILTTAFLTGATLLLRNGVDLRHFNSQDRDADAQAEMVDNYNAYSAAIASIFGRPIEIAVSLMVQVLVLRFATASVLQPETSSRFQYLAWFFALLLGYLVNNAFNALNVQLRALDVQPVISMSDLSVASTTNESLINGNVTTASRTFTEASTRNPIVNTVLRNAVMPRVWTSDSNRTCTLAPPNIIIPLDDIVDFGFPIRSWQRDMFPVALEADVLRVPVANKSTISSENLPMKTSRAAYLFINGVLMTQQFLPWFAEVNNDLQAEMKRLHPDLRVNETASETVTTVANLLPSKATDDASERKHFLSRSREIMNQWSTDEGSQPNMALEFAHIDISPAIRFDSVTFEIEMTPERMAAANATDKNGDAKWTVEQCDPSSGICMTVKPAYGVDGIIYSQIDAFASCEEDSLVFQLHKRSNKSLSSNVFCNSASPTSMLVVSIGKRLVADAMNSSASGKIQVDNLRKIYTVTIGRLEWELEDLSEVFHATCNVTEGHECNGLQYVLAGQNAHVVVGADKLPLQQLTQLSYDDLVTPRILSLVKVVEPSTQANDGVTGLYNLAAGDMLLPHNVGKYQWTDPGKYECSQTIEDRLAHVLNNHLYIEHPLQVSYTTAMFFLFQDGTMRDNIKLLGGRNSLLFDQNVQTLALRLSIPQVNAGLTLIGGALLSIGAVAVVVYTWLLSKKARPDPLGGISQPHLVAQILLDESKFPPALLHRRLVDLLDDKSAHEELRTFLIGALSLAPQDPTAPAQRREFGVFQTRPIGAMNAPLRPSVGDTSLSHSTTP
ncbi:hypothetical protein Poli38472_003280 [Pythium oligandrum]|uniref:Uncharacterized protein n=1 Tax=Pythium oligandrum TaxID=41045 RepID=A0A8K1C6I7_PYTOL|nr:hypothetical protein Poli38472_003280 [Pythium oligandrum]|eukprot:TMW57355.1 hypothetical protein Poli38472_003280 [Pythium oligandrum]